MEGPFAPRPDESFRTLCGLDVTVARADVPQLGGRWFDATCLRCEKVWLART